jgi:hypothetical protein
MPPDEKYVAFFISIGLIFSVKLQSRYKAYLPDINYCDSVIRG